MAELVALLRADICLLARIDWQKSVQSRVTFALPSGSAHTHQTAGSGLALKLFGRALYRARAGQIFTMSDAEDIVLIPRDPESEAVSEVLILCLESTQQNLDLLEIHFRYGPDDHNIDLFRIMGGEMSGAWRRRLPGVGERAVVAAREQERDEAEPTILHPDNPTGLSRSEFRICMLIREGGNIDDIAGLLSISVPTVRSHLSRIYAKTRTAGHLELFQKLHRQSAGEEGGTLTA